ncbi:MAG: Zn-ribbon domain-containing OB-fold protein [Pseudomonadota bacterium]|nr:Zn-ribbon domain-containing OB-fold protein [Pseudomonadota bacterium]
MSEETNAAAGTKTRQPALEGWFTLNQDQPHLIGNQCNSCGTYYFPRARHFCKNPVCNGEQFDDVELSRTGRVWSFTNAEYQPPPPYVAAEPFVPFTIAAVELAKEKMIVLGQVVAGVNPSDLRAGMEMELVLDTLFEDDSAEHITWKWKPVASNHHES